MNAAYDRLRWSVAALLLLAVALLSVRVPLARADSGAAWSQTAALSRHPSNLSADPTSAATAWVGLSYPLGVMLTTDGGKTWKQMLP